MSMAPVMESASWSGRSVFVISSDPTMSEGTVSRSMARVVGSGAAMLTPSMVTAENSDGPPRTLM